VSRYDLQLSVDQRLKLTFESPTVLAEFDPDDIWKTEDTVEKSTSEESVQDRIHQFWERKYPTRYVYDAARERQANRQRDEDLQARRPVRVASLHTSGGVGGSTTD